MSDANQQLSSDNRQDDTINEWEAFCDQLKNSGREILQAGKDMDEVTRADGLRYLGRLMRGGVEKFVEYGDPADPMVYKIYHEKIKWGFDNPDSIYNMATISGDRDYVLTGNRGTVNYFNISTMAMGVDGRASITGFVNDSDIAFDDSGNFTLAISANPQDGDWLKMTPDSNAFMIRQTFNNRAQEKEVEATMRCTTPGSGAGALEVDAVVDNFRKAGNFFTRTGKTFVDLTSRLMNHVNEMPEADPLYMKAMGGDPNYAYFWSSFHVEPGQALLIHLPRVPACDAWNLCLYNYWLESLDFHKATVIINKQNAKLNPDGSLTMVISMDDPGVANWLNSCGHPWGNIMMRWTKPEEVVAPIPELVQLDTVDWATRLKKWV